LTVLQQKIRQKGFSRATSYDYANTIRFLNSLLPNSSANSIPNQPLETPKETWQKKWRDMVEALQTIRYLNAANEKALLGCFTAIVQIMQMINEPEFSPQAKHKLINYELNKIQQVLFMIADEV